MSLTSTSPDGSPALRPANPAVTTNLGTSAGQIHSCCPVENQCLPEYHPAALSSATGTLHVSRWGAERAITEPGQSAATDFGSSPMDLDSDNDRDEVFKDPLARPNENPGVSDAHYGALRDWEIPAHIVDHGRSSQTGTGINNLRTNPDWDPREPNRQEEGRRLDSSSVGQNAKPGDDHYLEQSKSHFPTEGHQIPLHDGDQNVVTHPPGPRVRETRPWRLAQGTKEKKRRDGFNPLLGTKPSPGELHKMMGLPSNIPGEEKQARVKHLTTRAGQLSGLDLNVTRKYHPPGRFAEALLAIKSQAPYTYWSTALVELLLVNAIDEVRNSNALALSNRTATTTQIQSMMGISLELNFAQRNQEEARLRALAVSLSGLNLRVERHDKWLPGTAIKAVRTGMQSLNWTTSLIKYLLLEEISKSQDAQRVGTMPRTQSVYATRRKQVPPGPTLPSLHVDPIPRNQAGRSSQRPTTRRFNELLANLPHPAKLHQLLGLGIPLTLDEREAGVGRLSAAAGAVSELDLTVDWKEHQKAGRHIYAVQAVEADARFANWGPDLIELMLMKAVEAARLGKQLMVVVAGDEAVNQRADPGQPAESATILYDQRVCIADPKTPEDARLSEDHDLDPRGLDIPTTPEEEPMRNRSSPCLVHDSEGSVSAQTDSLDQAPDRDSCSDESVWHPQEPETHVEYDRGAIDAVRTTLKRLESDLLHNTQLLTKEREQVRRLQEHGLCTNAARQEVMRLERNAWEFRDSINGLRRSLGDWF